jgi:hypothetical protein
MGQVAPVTPQMVLSLIHTQTTVTTFVYSAMVCPVVAAFVEHLGIRKRIRGKWDFWKILSLAISVAILTTQTSGT